MEYSHIMFSDPAGSGTQKLYPELQLFPIFQDTQQSLQTMGRQLHTLTL